MFKKCLYFFLGVLFLQNACFADKEALKGVNQQYMALMLGAEGILPQKATPEQINQMIDGCITTGITDRLYGLGDKSAIFQAQIAKFKGYKKLDVQLAYAFYMLGYTKASYEELKQSLGVPLDPNFDREFGDICALVFPGRNILEYTNRLEDVIKRTSKPLRFDDFMEVVPGRAPSPDLSGILSPVTTRSRSSVMTMRPKANAQTSALYKKLEALGVDSSEIGALLGDYAENYVEEADMPGVSASLASLAFSADAEKTERYYTDDELDDLVFQSKITQGKADQYKEMRDKETAPENISKSLSMIPMKIDRYYSEEEIRELEADKAAKYRQMQGKGLDAKKIAKAVGVPPKYEGE